MTAPGSPSSAERVCRPDCGACCIAPSITSPIPGMPDGKPAGVRCVQLGPDERCMIFGRADRPAVCGSLRPSEEMCGNSRDHAMVWLERMEAHTAPDHNGGLI
ncbi:YkgJ family cysteine cluster protein [Trinickia soli]|uniref:Zinc/iron-chelating domain-containing protein n=1 Tax=Trinickia soli TaxID=380675 RepID=A0A2N7WCW5_9BURK|nr:YkgJ family cysteine cluster protein [Trinickia soli]KAA0077318.1 YkgJ family cysteine cluster protein [Paraburkholderia sp. T12-10]PMS27269.1 zinc/iron-chelating domain-containing protein [Trinickia soli]